jgi:dihydroorotase
MILKNAKIYSDGLIRKGAILIKNGVIKKLFYETSEVDFKTFEDLSEDGKEIDCQNKLIIPGIIDIHSHLRDMGQSEKETFVTGTKAAAFSGITTIFNMPNTKPPAITAEQVGNWIEKAKKSIHVNVGFIAGVPKGVNYGEVIKIVELGVIGFKIYPLSSLNEIDWTDSLNIQKLLNISFKFQIPIFIHPDWPLSEKKKADLYQTFMDERYPFLKFHDKLFPTHMEARYVNFILENYYKIIADNNIDPDNYPIVHFCHISSKDSYSLIQKAYKTNSNLKITFEITPHHLLLSNELQLENPNHGKVLPPLRGPEHPSFLLNELKEGNVNLIGTDHAPHTLEEKSEELGAPSGFPGFETYPLLLLDKVSKYELSLENFVKAASENPAMQFNLKNKGFIKEGFDADLMIIDKIPEYPIKSQTFKTKAKYSPFENSMTSIQISKVFIGGLEVNLDNSEPIGKIIRQSYKI